MLNVKETWMKRVPSHIMTDSSSHVLTLIILVPFICCPLWMISSTRITPLVSNCFSDNLSLATQLYISLIFPKAFYKHIDFLSCVYFKGQRNEISF